MHINDYLATTTYLHTPHYVHTYLTAPTPAT